MITRIRRLLLCLRLKAYGYETVYAANPLEAIMMNHQAQPDAILLDLELPGISGFLVLERMKSVPALAFIPVVNVSAEDPQMAQAKALALGAVAFLQKPVSRRILIQTIEQSLAATHELAKKSA